MSTSMRVSPAHLPLSQRKPGGILNVFLMDFRHIFEKVLLREHWNAPSLQQDVKKKEEEKNKSSIGKEEANSTKANCAWKLNTFWNEDFSMTNKLVIMTKHFTQQFLSMLSAPRCYQRDKDSSSSHQKFLSFFLSLSFWGTKMKITL